MMKRTAQIFKALSDEIRLRIINLLQASGELCVCDLMAVLDLPQSTVSRHLAYLRNANLVVDQRKGVWMYYQLINSDGFIDIILISMEKQFKSIGTAQDDLERLSEYIRTKEPDTCA